MARRRLTILLTYGSVACMVVFALLAVTRWGLPEAVSGRGLLGSTAAFFACLVWWLAGLPREERPPALALTLSTLAFTVCFMCWTMNGVLVTYLVDHDLLTLTKTQVGALLGVPILTGSLTRLPVGILTDRYGGKRVFGLLMLVSAVPLFLVGTARSYAAFWWLSLGFGLVGASFAVGIAYCSIWFPKHQQGTALGIFGAGNAGASLTSFGAPLLLRAMTAGDAHPERWVALPQGYAVALAVMGLLFLLVAPDRRYDDRHITSLAARLAPLRHVRVWRFGLYYFLVFGGFVALATWLVPYYVSVYGVSLAAAGALATVYSLPSGVIRAVGGWMSDRWGARLVMYWVLGVCLVSCGLLCVPRMDIETPGLSVAALRPGTVTAVSAAEIAVDGRAYPLRVRGDQPLPELHAAEGGFLPSGLFWQEPVVQVGERVKRKQLLAAGVTRLHFPAHIVVFTALVFIVGFAMGIGKAAVYRHIPDYFPHEVGVVGGLVGVLGGLGGWAGPYLFGWMLEQTGLWTTCWIFFTGLSAVCLVWMHLVIQRMSRAPAPPPAAAGGS